MNGEGETVPTKRGREPSRTLILHAKAPLPGFAKSRLVDPSSGLDAEFVARLSHAFFLDTLDNARRSDHDELVFHFTPADAAPYFRELDRHARLDAQIDAPFGSRLESAFARSFAPGPRRVVLIGMDTPHLSAATIDRAFEALDRYDVVLGPAKDGGYYLLGMRERRDHLFQDIAWSTRRVAAQTRERARECGATLFELETTFDVDRPEDLTALREFLIGAPGQCASTTALLFDSPGSNGTTR